MKRLWILAMGVSIFTTMFLGLTPAANAGCSLTIRVKNTGNATFTVNWSDSKLKVKGGLWAKIRDGRESVAPGKIVSTTYQALFNCGTNRRYQIVTEKGGSVKTTYYPSSSGWTTSQTVTVNISM